MEKVAAKKDMPDFIKQDRPKKVKEIYKALKKDHPEMPAAMKARIAARQGKPGRQKQGPPYKGALTKQAIIEKLAAEPSWWGQGKATLVDPKGVSTSYNYSDYFHNPWKDSKDN